MNKGLSLIETLTALLILSIVLVIIFGFIQTGHSVFTKSFKDFLIKNDYDKLVTLIKKDFNNLKQIEEIQPGKLQLLTQDNILLTYKIIKDNNKLIIYRQDKEIKFKNIKFSNIYFEAFDKTGEKAAYPHKIILIKIFTAYLYSKKIQHNTFELFEIKPQPI